MKRIHVVLSGWSTGFFLALLGFNALANDDKVFNGSMCAFTEPGHYAGQDRSNIKLQNASGQTETVSCPLKRDDPTTSLYAAYVIASAEMDEDTCQLWEREDDFSFSVFTHNSVTSVAPGYNKTAFADGSDTITLTNYASLQITCDLPDDSTIYNYWFWEI